MKVTRKVYRANAKDIEAFTKYIEGLSDSLQKAVELEKVLTFSLYAYNQTVYAYVEWVGEDAGMESLVGDVSEYLFILPGNRGERFWVEMMDIHHWHKPESVEQWKRKAPVEARKGMLNQLRPEMVSSYIFYHVWHQEATPGVGNKYVSAYVDEDYIFMYVELPSVVEPTSYGPTMEEGLLPRGPSWHEVMEKHFKKMPETESDPGKYWYELKTIISV